MTKASIKTIGLFGVIVAFCGIMVVCGDVDPGDLGSHPGAGGKADGDGDPAQLPVWRKHYNDYYLDTVQPVLDRRCASCHSCYNAPCQLKLTSYEGVTRGASKQQVYQSRLFSAMSPTRLFIDAKTASEWQQHKGFFPVVHNAANNTALNIKKSLLQQLLEQGQQQKAQSPYLHGQATTFSGVAEESRECPKDDQELQTFFKKYPDRGMPFGCPQLGTYEYETILNWVKAGAPGPGAQAQAALEAPSTGAAGRQVLDAWEALLNGTSAKDRLAARYLYEHLFLAEIYFDAIPGDYWRLVRSRTPSPQPVDEIATVLPYDDPGSGPLHYRFSKITSTIMHKTHTVYRLDNARMARLRALFFDADWGAAPVVLPGYDNDVAANPFVAFAQIPARARYQFLLDDAHYTILTFINGPVCRGKSALNVIRDHFMVLFLDPDSDLSVTDPAFLPQAASKLELPTTGRDNPFLNAYPTYKLKQRSYVALRDTYYAKRYPTGHALDDLWDGDGSKPALVTVYRHFDSGAAFPGVRGNIPKTVLLVDYPVMERIYYNLVAGFNVFGTVSHQVAVRAYMDGLRVEAEDNFINLLPMSERKAIRAAWYQGFPAQVKMTIANQLLGGDRPTQISFDPTGQKDRVQDLLEQALAQRLSPASRGVTDPIDPFTLPTAGAAGAVGPVASEADLDRELGKLSGRYGEFIRPLPDVAFLRVTRGGVDKDLTYTIVRNRAHQNVSFITLENFFVDPKHDTLNVIKGFAASYPNFFFVVPEAEASSFIQELLALGPKRDAAFAAFVTRYGVRRGDSRLWTSLDWFHERFFLDDPVRAGLFDINRYENL